jgi:hypothetical protein
MALERLSAMRNFYIAMGSILSCLLVLVVPGFSNPQFGARNPVMVTPTGTITAQQLAQDDSSGSTAEPQPDQPNGDDSSANGDNSNQLNAQPGDESGYDAPQGNPSDSDNGGESPQMEANPDDSGNENSDQSSQNPDDSQNPNESGDSQ